jgi:hypothetical protein
VKDQACLGLETNKKGRGHTGGGTGLFLLVNPFTGSAELILKPWSHRRWDRAFSFSQPLHRISGANPEAVVTPEVGPGFFFNAGCFCLVNKIQEKKLTNSLIICFI